MKKIFVPIIALLATTIVFAGCGKFRTDSVFVTLAPELSKNEYTVDDFPEIQISHIEWVSIYTPQTIIIYLKKPSKKNVDNAIKVLGARADVLFVERVNKGGGAKAD
jgi:predicted small integral membrane protein